MTLDPNAGDNANAKTINLTTMTIHMAELGKINNESRSVSFTNVQHCSKKVICRGRLCDDPAGEAHGDGEGDPPIVMEGYNKSLTPGDTQASQKNDVGLTPGGVKWSRRRLLRPRIMLRPPRIICRRRRSRRFERSAGMIDAWTVGRWNRIGVTSSTGASIAFDVPVSTEGWVFP